MTTSLSKPANIEMEPETLRRFTINGSVTLEKHLANICDQVRDRILEIVPREKLEGVALGGGYGRGEGGVLKTSVGEQPYNDLEFYVFVRGHPWRNEQRYGKAIHKLAEELMPLAGIELEFKITSLAKLRRSTVSLFYHDLLLGHRWLVGDEGLFAGLAHYRRASRLPLSEATRLLMNRCSGLLFAREKLQQKEFTKEDADFVCRNLAKTEMACGDAMLIAAGKYHSSCLVRAERLKLFYPEGFSKLAALRRHHRLGVEFKLQPYRSTHTRGELWENFRAVNLLAQDVWLWLENFRLGRKFNSAADYAGAMVNKWPGGNRWKNRLANLKVFGVRALFSRRNRRHPRDRILNALAALLWVPSEGISTTTGIVHRELLCVGNGEILSEYRERWRRAS